MAARLDDALGTPAQHIICRRCKLAPDGVVVDGRNALKCPRCGVTDNLPIRISGQEDRDRLTKDMAEQLKRSLPGVEVNITFEGLDEPDSPFVIGVPKD